MRRLAGLLLALPLLGALAAPAAAIADPLLTPVCPTSGPPVCFTDESHTPQVTVPVGATDATYAHFGVTVTNTGSSTVTHFSIGAALTVPTTTGTAPLPPTSYSVDSVAGTGAGGKAAVCADLTCSYGNLPADAKASIDLVVRLNSTAPVGSVTNTFTLSLDEGTNDNPSNTGGKTDYASYPQSASLVARTGSSVFSYVRTGGATLTTDQGGRTFAAASTNETEVGTTVIPALSAPLFASVARVGDDSAGATCPGVCAMKSDWMQSSVPDFGTLGSGYLQTTVRVDSSLVAAVKGLGPNTVVVYYRPTADALKTDVLSKCTFKAGAPTSVPCYTATKEKDGDLTVTVWELHNGFIRL